MACGTARMSLKNDTCGVDDPDVRIEGVDSVRIMDASVFPEIPECHTMVPVYILA